jgi:hypothetical protein
MNTPRSSFRGITTVLLTVLCFPPGVLAAPEYIEAEQPVAGHVEESLDSIEHAFKRAKVVRPYRRLLDSLQNGSLSLGLRNYYLNREREQLPNSEAWAQGGALDYDSAWWKDRVRIGATLYTTQKLYGPSDKDGTLLLKRGQESFTVLGEAYIEAKLVDDVILKLYRQGLYMPYVNRNNSRMIPNTFEAYTISNTSSERFVYGLGQVDKIKQRASDKFVSMTEAAGIDGKDHGVTMGGFRYKFDNGANIGAVDEYARDFMNIFYIEANTRNRTLFDISTQLSGQYTNQRSVGDELGGKFDTWTWGLKAAASYAGVVLTLAHTSTDSNAGIISPWGGRPSYLSIMLQDFDRADEDGWLIGMSTDFRSLNLKGLGTFVNYAVGNTPDSGRNASPDQKEFDITLEYRREEGLLEGLSMRLRYAKVNQDGINGNDISDLRAIVNYTLPLM